MCGIKCTTTALSAQMAKEVQVYFEDPESSLDKLRKVMDFQKSHRQKLNENYRRLFEKYQMLKVGYQKLEEEMKRLRQELEIIKGNTNCANILTPPQSSNQYPLFSKNSQASKVIRLGMSQPLGNGNPASPLFVTPSKTGFSGQQYSNGLSHKEFIEELKRLVEKQTDTLPEPQDGQELATTSSPMVQEQEQSSNGSFKYNLNTSDSETPSFSGWNLRAPQTPNIF
ncbi:hypothetical protein J6590_046507 [Homalodisca vitripennis]|nr:hypothetical protein J6590_046507 [Homalodisca vitripennis]